MKNITFGEAVKARRKALGLTAEKLADKAGIVRTYISRIERHNILPSPEVFNKIEKALNTSLSRKYIKEKFPELAKYESHNYNTTGYPSPERNSKEANIVEHLNDFIQENHSDYKRAVTIFFIERVPELAQDKEAINKFAPVVEKTYKIWRKSIETISGAQREAAIVLLKMLRAKT